MIKRIVLAAAILLGSGGLARAELNHFWEFEAAGWEGGAFKDEQGNFSHCYITSAYEGGILLGFTLTAGDEFSIVLKDETWRLPVDSRYEVVVSVDSRRFGGFPATAAGEDLLRIELGRRPDAFQRMRKGYTLNIEAAKEVFAFNLDGTAKGLAKLRECHDVAMALTRPNRNPFARGETGRQANPFAQGGGQGGGQGSARAPGAPLYDERQVAEDRELVEGVLLASGLEDVNFVSPAELQFDTADYAWVAGGILGVMLTIDPQQSTLSELTDAFLAGVAISCAGDFRSQSPALKRISGSEVKQFTAACRERGADAVYYAGTSVASGGDMLLFLNFTADEPDALRRLNDRMGDLFVTLLRTD